MADFPAAIKTFTNPTSTSKQNSPVHSTQHIEVNNEITAIETALGIDLVNVVKKTMVNTDPLFLANSDSFIPTQKAVKTYADSLVVGAGGVPIGYLDIDETLAANSDTKIATQKATKTYVDSITLNGASFVNLGAIPAGAGDIPLANMPALLGAWAGISFATVYLAATDGFVTAYISDNRSPTSTGITIETGAANPPAETRVATLVQGPDAVIALQSAVCPIKKGHYYKVSFTGVGSGAAYFIPMGS